jgi:hypothetical protein
MTVRTSLTLISMNRSSRFLPNASATAVPLLAVG